MAVGRGDRGEDPGAERAQVEGRPRFRHRGLELEEEVRTPDRRRDGDVITLGVHDLIYTDLRSSIDFADTQSGEETAPGEAENDDDNEDAVVGE